MLIDRAEPADLRGLREVAERTPHALAVCDAEGTALSFAALLHEAEMVASTLAALVPQDGLVALSVTTRLPSFVLIHALLLLRRAFAPLHPRLTEPERGALLARLSPALFLDDVAVDALFRDARAGGVAPRRDAARGTSSGRDRLAILPTSGTSGVPKLAVLSRGAFAASARGTTEALSLSPHDRWLLALPLCHVGGLSVLTRSLATGASVLLLPRFEASAAGALARERKATLFPLVPTMLRDLLAHDLDDFASVRAAIVGGAGCPESLLQSCAAQRFLALTTYGLTEACSQIALQRPRPPEVRALGSGRPLSTSTLTIMREDGSLAAAGETGAIVVSGPTMMDGYLDPSPSPEAAGRAFPTGDAGYLSPGGELFVEGRRLDRVVTGGENVAPAEVESVARAAPGVRDAVVFGIPDERWGEAVALCLVVDEASFDRARLDEALMSRLAPFKRPRAITIIPAVPLTSLGKPDRKEARRVYGSAALAGKRVTTRG